MQLKEIISRSLNFASDGQKIDRHKAEGFGFALVEEDHDLLTECARAGFSRSIKEAAIRQQRKMLNDAGAQSCFDVLRRRYPLDVEAKVIKETDYLTEMELDRIIAVRDKSVADDMAHLSALKEVRASLKPIWKSHPEWTLGEAERAFRGLRDAA